MIIKNTACQNTGTKITGERHRFHKAKLACRESL